MAVKSMQYAMPLLHLYLYEPQCKLAKPSPLHRRRALIYPTLKVRAPHTPQTRIVLRSPTPATSSKNVPYNPNTIPANPTTAAPASAIPVSFAAILPVAIAPTAPWPVLWSVKSPVSDAPAPAVVIAAAPVLVAAAVLSTLPLHSVVPSLMSRLVQVAGALTEEKERVVGRFVRRDC